jgi:hypothetical protein
LADDSERYRQLRISIGWGESLAEVMAEGATNPRHPTGRGIIVEFRSLDGISQFEVMRLPLRMDYRRPLRPSNSYQLVYADTVEAPPWENSFREYQLQSGGAVPVYLERAS